MFFHRRLGKFLSESMDGVLTYHDDKCITHPPSTRRPRRRELPDQESTGRRYIDAESLGGPRSEEVPPSVGGAGRIVREV